MLGLIKKVLILALTSTVNSSHCISLKKQECKVRKVIVRNYYMIYPYNIKVNRCNGNCNNVNNPYTRLCLPDVVKNNTFKQYNKIKQNK